MVSARVEEHVERMGEIDGVKIGLKLLKCCFSKPLTNAGARTMTRSPWMPYQSISHREPRAIARFAFKSTSYDDDVFIEDKTEVEFPFCIIL